MPLLRKRRANSKQTRAPMLWPKKALGMFSLGVTTGISAASNGTSRVIGPSCWLVSYRGRLMAHNSTCRPKCKGKSAAHESNVDVPPPANGKQNRRRRAFALGFLHAKKSRRDEDVNTLYPAHNDWPLPAAILGPLSQAAFRKQALASSLTLFRVERHTPVCEHMSNHDSYCAKSSYSSIPNALPSIS